MYLQKYNSMHLLLVGVCWTIVSVCCFHWSCNNPLKTLWRLLTTKMCPYNCHCNQHFFFSHRDTLVLKPASLICEELILLFKIGLNYSKLTDDDVNDRWTNVALETFYTQTLYGSELNCAACKCSSTRILQPVYMRVSEPLVSALAWLPSCFFLVFFFCFCLHFSFASFSPDTHPSTITYNRSGRNPYQLKKTFHFMSAHTHTHTHTLCFSCCAVTPLLTCVCWHSLLHPWATKRCG